MRAPSAYSHHNKDGTPKVRLTRSMAKRRCVANSRLTAYWCSACKGWHVGNSRGKTNTPTEWTRTWDRARVELGLSAV